MGHADLYTQTSAQTVNNGTHTRTHIVTSQMYSHTHLAVTEPTRNYQWPNTCPHKHHMYITQGFTTLCEATSPAAPKEVLHYSLTLHLHILPAFNTVRDERYIKQMNG